MAIVAMKPSCRFQWLWILVLLGPSIIASASSSATTNLRRRKMVVGQAEFVEQCTLALLSDDNVDDGLISQDEFANFLTGYCVLLNVCDPATELDFESLSVQLQLAFVLFICDQPDDLEREQCLDSLNQTGGEFGYDMSAETFSVVEMEVKQLCSQAYPYSLLMGLLPPTVTPTTGPTATPSLPPTAVSSPTGAPNDGSSQPPSDGTNPGGATGGENNDPMVSVNSESGLSTSAIAGVTVAAAVFVVAFLLFHRRRRRTVDHDKDVEYPVAGDESIFTEDSAQFKLGLPQSLQGSVRANSIAGSSAKGGSSGGSDYTPKNLMVGTRKSRSVAQFDPSNAAAAIALGLGGTAVVMAGSRGNSARSLNNDTKEAKIQDLDEAIHRADWDAVARLAGSLASSSEEVSTLSERSSSAGPAASVGSSLSSLHSEEARIAAQIDELVQRGDWSGVATAAEHFSATRRRDGTNHSATGILGELPRRSFLDFVTGRSILSLAADAAIVPTSQDVIECEDISESEHSGLGVGVATPVVYVSDAGQSNTIETESSSSHGSQKDNRVDQASNAIYAAAPIAPVVTEKSNKSWLGRFWSGRTASKESFDSSVQAVTAASLPLPPSGDSEEGAKKPAAISSVKMLRAELEEALNCGDWGAVEVISAKIDATITDTSRQRGTNRSAIGTQLLSKLSKSIPSSNADEDPVLEATNLSSIKSGAKQPREVSTPSRRAELDNAVERGDWDSVERLTTELLNTNPAPPRDDSFKILAEDDKLTDTLMDSMLLPITPTPGKSPFRPTPSSSEWSQTPVDREKMDAIRKLVNAEDWKSVNVLSGIFEMEKKGTLPPTFASMSADSMESPAFARGWQRHGPMGTPLQMEGQEPSRPPPSPATSSSTGASVDLREFQRLVNEKDWKGLASFAGAEQEQDFDNEELLALDLFGADPEKESNELDQVELRKTAGPQPEIEYTESEESLHGAEELIPFWEQVIKQHSPSKSKTKERKEKK